MGRLTENLDAIADRIRDNFVSKDAAREKVLPICREVIRYSSLSIRALHRQELDKAQEFARRTTDSGIDVFRLKGFTNFAVAKATAMVIEAIQHDQKHTIPLSVMLQGYCGIDDVCLSIPVVIGRNGISRRLHPQLAAAEEAAFRASAEAVRQNNQQILPILNESVG